MSDRRRLARAGWIASQIVLSKVQCLKCGAANGCAAPVKNLFLLFAIFGLHRSLQDSIFIDLLLTGLLLWSRPTASKGEDFGIGLSLDLPDSVKSI
jgi:hypothetical protein